jgi:hypothetical protein
MRAFLAFTEAAALPVEPGSVLEPPPRAPDILADTGGERVAYEVTEALEQSYARRLSTLMQSTELIRNVYKGYCQVNVNHARYEAKYPFSTTRYQ